jgi:hypothetical protein
MKSIAGGHEPRSRGFLAADLAECNKTGADVSRCEDLVRILNVGSMDGLGGVNRLHERGLYPNTRPNNCESVVSHYIAMPQGD